MKKCPTSPSALAKKPRCFIFLFLLSLVIHPVAAQAQDTVQWASKVIKYSSELSHAEYAASQILGMPNVLPGGGDNPSAWMPSKPNKVEYIKVGFDNPMQIQQVAIGESYHPSAVVGVFAYDSADNEYSISNHSPKSLTVDGRFLHVFFDRTTFDVHAVKVVLMGGAVPGYQGIDAIAIADTQKPVEVEIRTAHIANADELMPQRLNANVNSQYPEIRPVITPDGGTLYFSRKYHPDNMGREFDHEDIWFSDLHPRTGKWHKAQNAGEMLNNKGPNHICSITAFGDTLLFLLGNTYKRNKMKPGVSFCMKTPEGWTEPKELVIAESYLMDLENVDFFLAPSGKTLLMTFERFDTHGLKDIYVSFMGKDSIWTTPKNLGPQVNSAHHENSPILLEDETTLYFSSMGLTGYGGSDIYVTRRLDSTWTNWSEPENLGPAINSPNDDAFFSVTEQGDYAYFSRGNLQEDVDIYRVQLPHYVPEPLLASAAPPKKRDNALQEFELVEYPDGSAMVSAGNSAFIVVGDAQKTNEATSEAVTRINVKLRNVYFGVGETEVKQPISSLQRLKQLFAENPNLQIELYGHSDNLGSKNYNQQVSEERATAVAQILEEEGFDRSRIKVIPVGEGEPLATNDDEKEGRELNRRVEFRITESR